MRVLVPDLPAFHALAQPGDTFLPGAELAFYSNDKGVPDGEAQGVVLWLANGATRDALLSVPGLQWVLTLTAGIEHVQGKLPQGAALYNAHRLHDRAVAVHVVAGMLAASRGLHRFRDAQQRGEWVRTSLADTGLSTLDGQKVVLWGYGHIGKIVEELLAPFGAQVYGLTSKTEPDLVDYRLAEADWVVLLLPSTERTRSIMNAERLAALKPGVWLSNQGRGDLIVTDDLLAALDSGHLGGAVLDVTDPEPLLAGHPLWDRENVVITPHIASTTSDLPERGAAYARSFILDVLQGRTPEGEVAPGDAY